MPNSSVSSYIFKGSSLDGVGSVVVIGTATGLEGRGFQYPPGYTYIKGKESSHWNYVFFYLICIGIAPIEDIKCRAQHMYMYTHMYIP
jgi:hypothetical protein